jgi:hypothetical protein
MSKAALSLVTKDGRKDVQLREDGRCCGEQRWLPSWLVRESIPRCTAATERLLLPLEGV